MSIKQNSVIFNDGFSSIKTHQLIGKLCNGYTIVFGDFAGDTKKDIACVDQDSNQLRIFENKEYSFKEINSIPLKEEICQNRVSIDTPRRNLSKSS